MSHGILLTGEGIHFEPFIHFEGRCVSQGKVLPQDLAKDRKRYLSLDKILLTFHTCQAANANAGIKWSQASHLCAVCFPSGEVTEPCGQLASKVLNQDPFAFRVRVLLFHTSCLQAEMYRLSQVTDIAQSLRS